MLKYFIRPLLLALPLACCAASVQAEPYAWEGNPKSTVLFQTLQQQYGFSTEDLLKVKMWLSEANFRPELVKAEQGNKEKTTPVWDNYRNLHVFSGNIRNGVKFFQENQAWLQKAEAEYGVPAAIIVGILGVETKYGTFTGRSRVLDALVTQGFEHPTRSGFFFEELVGFFVTCKRFDLDPLTVKGSYAGAMGFAQFMPTNYNKLTVDYDQNGSISLWTAPDAIGSIARYFNEYIHPERGGVHWKKDQPLLIPARLTGAVPENSMLNGKRVDTTLGRLRSEGVQFEASLPDDTAAGLLMLNRPTGPEYWIALHNFYVVMSYNPRVYYAMSVTQLAEEIQNAVYAPKEAAKP